MFHQATWLVGGLALLIFVEASIAATSPSASPTIRSDALVRDIQGKTLPFTPIHPQTEIDRDRATSAALWAYGQILYRADRSTEALRQYQRAYRCNPDATIILYDIVGLTFDLHHNATAARYAVLLAENELADKELLEHLACYLFNQPDIPRALKFYEKAIALRGGDDKPDAKIVQLRFETGQLYFLNHDFAKSAQSFALVRDALAHPKRFHLNATQRKEILDEKELTYTLMGESFLLAKRLDEAKALFDKAYAAKPDKARYAFQMARIEDAKKEAGDPTQTLQYLQEYFDTKKTNEGSDPYKLLAKTIRKTCKNKEATKKALTQRLNQLLQTDPKNTSLRYYLAKRYYDAGDWKQAEKAYRHAMKLRPTVTGYQALAEIYQRAGQMNRLIDLLGTAVAKTATIQPLGDAIDKLAKDKMAMDKIIAAALQREKLLPKQFNADTALGMALLSVAAKRFDEADTFFQRAVAKAADDKKATLTLWGLEMLMAEQSRRAAIAFRRAICEESDSKKQATLYYYLASALETGGKTAEAIAVANQAIQLDPDSLQFKTRVPWILYHSHQLRKAEQAYLRMLKKLDTNHKDEEVREVVRDIRFVLSDICSKQGRNEEAEEWLQQILDEFPEDTGVMNDLGYLWADRGKHLHRSLKMIRRAVQAEPENIAYRDSLGWVLYKLGRFQEAATELQKATANEEEIDGELWDHLGEIYWKMNEHKKARDTWQKAVQAYQRKKDNQQTQAIQEKIKRRS